MKSKLLKALPALFLIIPLIATYGIITGFVSDDMDVLGSESGTEEEEASAKLVCSECGYVYDPIVGDPENGVEPGTKFKDLPDDWVCPECKAGVEDFEEVVVVLWVCPYCGYVYDPEVEETPFEDLPDDWVCPGCNTLKEDFVEDEEYGEYISSDPWVTHLQHVLEMRSKHISVLERVIKEHKAKDADHSSIPGLENALISSSKSVLKAKDAIDAYLGYLGSFKTVGDEGNTEDEEVLLNSGDDEGEDAGNGNGKENNAGKDKKGKKEHTNKGKAKGKNK